MPTVNCIRIKGVVDYAAMLERQQAVHGAVASGDMPSTLFLMEHTPTITLGRNALSEHILCDNKGLQKAGVKIIPTDRGGDVTYHGPGQLVAYPVFDLNHWKTSVDWYLRALEETVILVLESYGLKGERLPKYTGVWVNDAKVAAIGIAVKHWISWHGLAINIDPNMQHWGLIIPCGIRNKPVTSLAQLLDDTPPVDEVAERCIDAFRSVFECEVVKTTLKGPEAL